jgi:NADPH2:quinone reductase
MPNGITCTSFDGIDGLRWMALPERETGRDEVRIRVHAAGINFADILMVSGQYQVKPRFPFSPGLECAGVISEVGGDVQGLAVGDRVLAVTRFGGSYVEELVVGAATVVPIPENMDFVTAAGFPVVYGTSHFALTHRGALKPGETLLVLGAAGGVGLTAVEIGKHLGATVIAAAGTDEKLALTRAYGADYTINYTTESIRDRVREITGGRGADVVYDPVGGKAFDESLRAVNWEARLLVVGFASGTIQQVPANLVLVKNVSVIGVVWGAQIARDPAVITPRLRDLLEMYAEDRLRPRISMTFPMPEARAAMHELQSRRQAGKIVLTAEA